MAMSVDQKTSKGGEHVASKGAVFARAARMYVRNGLTCPLPLPARQKEPVPSGYTGSKGYDENGRPRLVGMKTLERWERDHAGGNIALRMVGGLIGIDVDAYGDKVGAQVLARAEAELGPLPDTYVSTARTDGISGIRWFRLPDGVKVDKHAEDNIIKQFGVDVEIKGRMRQVSHIDIIREDHRYAVVWPSIHPDTGEEYRWEDPDGVPLMDEVPNRDDFAFLPAAWVEFLTRFTSRADVLADEELSEDNDETEDAGFDTPESSSRSFDRDTVKGIIKRQLNELATTPRGQINETLTKVSYYLFHFAPVFIDERRLAKLLIQAQERAWIASGGEDDGDHTAARKTITRARADARKGWMAVCAEEDDDTPDPLDAIADSDGHGDGGNAAEEERVSNKKVGIFFTDARFSELVADVLRESGMLYTSGMGWMRWTGQRWERTEDRNDESAIEINRKWCLKRARIAKENLENVEPDTPESEVSRLEALVDAWRSMCSRSKLAATTALARPQVTVKAEDFDKQPDLLNTPDGVVDLRTGEVEPHDKNLLMTKITRAPYRGADFTDDRWDKALSAIPEDAQEWVQIFMGQGCTGRLNTEGRLLLIDGDGNNGKGCLTNEGAVWTLGDYAVVLSESLILGSGNQHPTEKMALRGARLTLIDETPEARHLDTQRLKKLLDQPVLPGARHLFKEEVRVELTHTMIVSTNYVPAVTEYDWGTWRRLARLTMPYTFRSARKMPPPERATPFDRLADSGIKVGLKEDPDVQAACLAWLVRGAMKWYAGGMCQPIGEEPERVQRDTKAWRSTGDLIMNYFEEFLTVAPGRCVSVAEMFKHFTEWTQTSGFKPWSIKTFSARFTGHDMIKEANPVTRRERSAKVADSLSHPPGSWDTALPGQINIMTNIAYQDDGGPDGRDDLFDMP